jgi:hypothetical protein
MYHALGRGDDKLYHSLAETPEWKRPAGRPRPRWEDNIKMDL